MAVVDMSRTVAGVNGKNRIDIKAFRRARNDEPVGTIGNFTTP